MKSDVIARIIYDEICCRYNHPAAIMSDKGGLFMGAIMTDLCKLLGISKFTSSSYRPQSNSTVERENQCIVNMLNS